MKKLLILLLLFISMSSMLSCGGGSGSSSSPPGEDPNTPFSIELRPSQYIAQTNSFIYIRARVLNGNGNPIPDIPVYFINLSSIGVLSDTVAKTDQNGFATVKVSSTTHGFATVQAEVNRGSGKVRDKKTVYFSFYKLELLPTLNLEVESIPSNETSGQTIYNDIHDITLFENDSDDTVEVVATVYDIYGQSVAGETVTWDKSHPEVKFRYAEVQTNIYGKAKAIVQVTPSSIKDTETSVNIMAYAGNGAANMTTLFLWPVVISGTASSLSAYPPVVNINGTSAVTAIIKLNTGAPVPDGTVVNFTATNGGSIDPFALTTNGIATATFKAPPSVPSGGSCAVSAKVGGITLGPVSIAITTDLLIMPERQTVNGVKGGSATFTIYGGYPGYTVTSSDPNIAYDSSPGDGIWKVSSSGGSFTVHVPTGTQEANVTLTVIDSAGKTKTATLVIGGGSTLTVKPSEVTINTKASTEDQTVSFYVSGGVPSYTIIKDKDNSVVELDTHTVTISGGKFVATVKKDAAVGTAVITVLDSIGNIATAKIVVSTTGGGGTGTMSISPAVASVAGIKNPDTSTVDNLEFLILGSDHIIFNCISSNPAIIASPGSTGAIFTVDPDEVLVATPVTITCTDFGGLVASTLVTVMPPGLTIRLNPIHVIGRANPAGGDGDTSDDVLVTVVGGIGPYIVNIEPFSLTTIVPGGPWANPVPWTFLVDPTNVLTNTVVTFKVTDNLGTTATATLVVYTENTGLVANTSKENVIGLTNPDGNTADDVTISVAGANNPFIVSWVCPAVGVCPAITATPAAPCLASPCVVNGTSGTVIFDPNNNACTDGAPRACTVNVTDKLGSAATLNVTVWQ